MTPERIHANPYTLSPIHPVVYYRLEWKLSRQIALHPNGQPAAFKSEEAAKEYADEIRKNDGVTKAWTSKARFRDPWWPKVTEDEVAAQKNGTGEPWEGPKHGQCHLSYELRKHDPNDAPKRASSTQEGQEEGAGMEG